MADGSYQSSAGKLTDDSVPSTPFSTIGGENSRIGAVGVLMNQNPSDNEIKGRKQFVLVLINVFVVLFCILLCSKVPVDIKTNRLLMLFQILGFMLLMINGIWCAVEMAIKRLGWMRVMMMFAPLMALSILLQIIGFMLKYVWHVK